MRTLGFVTFAFATGLGLEFGLGAAISDGSVRNLIMLAACNVIVALSLNVINGMAGQFSIGHAGFMGIGAYTSAVIACNLHEKLGGGEPTFARSFIVVPIALLSAGLVSGFFGLVVGLPSLRLRGDYLAIVTLGFAEIVRLLIATAQVTEQGETLGSAFTHVHGPSSFFHAVGVAISSLGGQNGYSGPNHEGVQLYAGPFWVFGIMLLVVLAAWRLKFSGWGRALRALREDEIAAAAVGVDPTRYKVTSFVISALGGGIAGGLMAQMRDGSYVVNPEDFNFQTSFNAITMVILGGSGSVSGAVLGSFFVTFTVKAIELLQNTSVAQAIRGPHHFGEGFDITVDLNALRMILYASVLVSLMVWRPEGVFGEREIGQKKRATS